MKKLALSLWALLALLSLAACGKEPEPEPEAAPESYILTHYTALPESVTGVSGCALDGERLLLCCREEADETNPVCYVAALDTGGSGFEKLPLKLKKEEQPLSLSPDGEGGFWCLCGLTDGEGAAHYSLRHFDSQNRQIAQTELDRFLEDQGVPARLDSYYPLYEACSLTADGEGRLCVMLRNIKTYCFLFDKKGNFLYFLQGEGNPKNVISTGSGQLAVCATEDFEASYALQPLDARKRSLGEGINLGPLNKVFSGDGEADFYVYDGAGFRRGSLEEGVGEELFNWSNLGLASGDAYVCPLSGGRFAVVAGSFSQTQLLRYEYCVAEPGEDSRTVLNMLSLQPGSDILEAVAQFNKSNADYRIDLDAYGAQYRDAAQEDWDKALEQLNLDLISGRVPDILDLSGLPADAYSRRGLLEDLYPYLESDPDFHPEDYYTNVFDALSIDGKLPYVTSSVSVATVLAAPDAAEGRQSWSVEEYLALLESGDLADKWETWKNPYWFLTTVSVMDGRFVDWENGKCFYDGEDFIRLMEACRACFQGTAQVQEALENGELQFNALCVPLMSVLDVSQYNARLGGQGRAIGYPSLSGEPAQLLEPANKIGFSSTCAHKDGAWTFVRSFLEPGMQESGLAFPYRKSSFEKLAAAAAGGHSIWASMFTGEVTQADLELAREILGGVNSCPNSDEELLQIIQEQLGLYITGSLSVEEAAAAIQSRATMYVGERY